MLHTPNGGIIAPEWVELERKIRGGDGLLWSGDPDLSLMVGVLTEKATGRTGIRLEVHRHCEDGSDQFLASWLPAEAYRICMDLAEMRPGSPGHIPVADALDAADRLREKEASAIYADKASEMLSHAAWTKNREDGDPKTRFSVPGLRDDVAKEFTENQEAFATGSLEHVSSALNNRAIRRSRSRARSMKDLRRYAG